MVPGQTLLSIISIFLIIIKLLKPSLSNFCTSVLCASDFCFGIRIAVNITKQRMEMDGLSTKDL